MSRILFADHNGFTQRMGIQFLSAEGHEVASASDGDDALRYIQEQRPDIAILDTQMTGPSGLELCWRIKSDSNLRDTKVVLLNRLLDPIANSEAEKAGSDALLLKPLDGSLLVGTVNSLIERMRSEIAAGAQRPEPCQPNGSRPLAGEFPEEPEGTPEVSGIGYMGSTNGTNGLAVLGFAVSDAADAHDATPAAVDVAQVEIQPAAVTSPNRDSFELEGAASTVEPGRVVVLTAPRKEIQIMNETEVCVEQEQGYSPAVDFAAIVDEALGNDTEERELQKRIERAIDQILQPAITAVAANVTREVYVAYRAQRRVEDAVNGLLLPAIVSIADGSSQGVLAAFRSK